MCCSSGTRFGVGFLVSDIDCSPLQPNSNVVTPNNFPKSTSGSGPVYILAVSNTGESPSSATNRCASEFTSGTSRKIGSPVRACADAALYRCLRDLQIVRRQRPNLPTLAALAHNGITHHSTTSDRRKRSRRRLTEPRPQKLIPPRRKYLPIIFAHRLKSDFRRRQDRRSNFRRLSAPR